jgi:hypothetical protein
MSTEYPVGSHIWHRFLITLIANLSEPVHGATYPSQWA